MLSVVIATENSERALVPTLSALVTGATAGAVREVILADAGSSDDTAEIGDIAGCDVMRIPGPLGQRLRAAAAVARSRWLLFLRPGLVLDAPWVTETMRFIQDTDLSAKDRAAVFRPPARPGTLSGMALESMALIRAAVTGQSDPDQGLMVSKTFYESLGGHRADAAHPERELLRRIGRRRIVMLRCGTAKAGAEA